MNTPNIETILKNAKTIAIVGLSDKPHRDSYRVAKYLREHGYTIIPVNPFLQEWEGIKAYPDLKSIPEQIDVVDIFRKSKFVSEIVEQAIGIRVKTIWMQIGVGDDDAKRKAEAAGINVVMNKCIKVEHMGFVL